MITPTLDVEQQFWKQGYSYICGLDEVGRGCFAGPVVVGAVIFTKNCQLIEGVADSKLLTPKRREELEAVIKQQAVAWAVAKVSVNVINRVGIGRATQMAFRKVIKTISRKPDFVVVDAFCIKHFNRQKQLAIIKGDQRCFSIAAASIIAKVHRDRLMKQLHQKYPNYGLSQHKGYGTKFHQQAIKEFGLSRIHRRSFNLDKFLT